MAAAVDAAVRAGVDWIQLRERELEGAALLHLARELCTVARRAALARSGCVKVLVNRRIDVALTIGADGAHLGFDAIAPQDATALMREGSAPLPLIGVSAHSAEEVAAAQRDGASYAHLAPIWAPLSKPATRAAIGAAALEAAARHGLPLLAQGGVGPERCAEVLAAGAAGVAVTGNILLAEDPGRAAAALRAALDR